MKRPTPLRPVVPLLVLLTALYVASGTDELNAGELKPAAVFSNHVVLQRDKPVPVWGRADPGERVAVEFAGQHRETTTGDDGRWSVTLEPLKASAKPRSLVVTAIAADADDGPGRRVEVRDVLVGEVWLGSGQANMAMTVGRAKDFETERAAADLPLIRMFQETSAAADSPQADGHGAWSVC
jgi:sialate O-acetylesterase